MFPTAPQRGECPSPAPSHERFLRLAEVAEAVGLARSTIYRFIHLHGFPAPVPLGGQRVAWLESEVQAWIQQRLAHRPSASQSVAPSVGIQSESTPSHNGPPKKRPGPSRHVPT